MNATLIPLAVLPLGLCGAALAPRQDAPAPDPIAQAAEEVEIMRRVLERRILGELPQSYQLYGAAWPRLSGGGGQLVVGPEAAPLPGELRIGSEILRYYDATNAYLGALGSEAAVGITHSAGFHVPGRGAVFALDVTLPPFVDLAAAPEPAPEPDLWEETRGAVRGGTLDLTAPGPRAQASGGGGRQAPAGGGTETVEAVRRAVLDTLARFGGRMKSLRADEECLVTVRFLSSTQAAWLDGAGSWLWATAHARPSVVRRLVVRLDQRTCEDFRAGRISIEEATAAARVTLY